MEPDPYPTEPLSDHWKDVGNALKNENRQWVQQVNVIDAENNQVGVVAYTQTEAFQHRYARRLVARTYPDRMRTRSLPLPHKPLWRVQRYTPTARDVQNDQPRFDWLRRVRNSGVQKLHQAKDATVDKLRWIGNRMAPLVNNVRRRKCRTTFIGMGLGLLIALAYTNGRAAHYKALQETPASLYVSSFPKYPTWLHTNPLQVIGLPTQVSPTFMPPRRTIEKACRKFKSTWHTDSRQHLLSYRDATAVVHRGDLACQLLEEYLNNQYADDTLLDIVNFHNFAGYILRNPLLPLVLNSSATVPAGAPHFAKSCSCTYAKYYRAWLYQVLMPVDLQPDPPRTLDKMCPCTFDMAMKSWESFSFSAKSPQPPYLDRIKNDLSPLTADPRVLWWRIKGLVFSDDRWIFDDEEAMDCAIGTLKGCEKMIGWTSPSDFQPNLREKKGIPLREGKMLKVKVKEEDRIIESEMSEEWILAKEEEEEKEEEEFEKNVPESWRQWMREERAKEARKRASERASKRASEQASMRKE